MRQKRIYKWRISVQYPPDTTRAMREIRRAYRQMRKAGVRCEEARHITINLLNYGSIVEVKAENIQ